MLRAIAALILLVALTAAVEYPKRPVDGSYVLLQFSEDHVEWVPENAAEEAAAHFHKDTGKTLQLPAVLNQVSQAARGVLSSRLRGESPLGLGFIDRTSHYEEGATSFEPRDVETPDYPAPNPATHTNATDLFGKVDTSLLKKTVVDLSTFNTRFYKSDMSTKGPKYLITRATEIVNNAKAENVVIKQIKNKGFNQDNVVLILSAPADQKVDDSIVVVGGHLDSTTGGDRNGRAPGADDDASGSAIVLETFRLLVESGWTGSRDVHFMFYAAEEGGLLGSATVAKKYLAAGIKVRAMLQMEMCGYQLNSVPVVTTLSDPNPKLSTWLASMVQNYLPEVTHRVSECGYGCSDHNSWNDAGFPAACISEAGPNDPGLNPNMHTVGDVASILNFDAMATFVKAGLAWVVEMAQ